MDADEAENPGDSDTTEGEANPEEGDASDETPDDNDTPVIDPADDVEEEPEVTAPAENEVPADAEDEAEEETTTAPGASVMAGDATNFTVSYKIMKDGTENSSAATVEFTNDCLGSGSAILEETNITFEVTPAEDYMLAEDDAVTAKAGESDLQVSEADGTYTITNGSGENAISDNVVITINVVDKTYTVNAPKDENSVTWKIKESTVTEYGNESSVEVKKGASVDVQATLAENADPVDVTVNEDTKSLTAENKTAVFTVAWADLEEAQDGSYSVTATYVPKKAEATVTVTGKDDVVLGEDFTAKYSIKDENEEFGAYKDVPANGEIAAYADDVIAFKFTANDKDGQARTVKDVYFGEANSDTAVKGEVDETTGETTYTVTVTKPVADSENNIVTVELENTNVITIKKAADAKIEKVEYSTSDDSSAYKPALVTADGWKVETKDSNVTFKVTAEVHNKVTYIHKGDGEHEVEDCENDMTFTSATVVTTTDGIDASENGETLTIATEQITVDYTLTAPEGADVTIQKADGTVVSATKSGSDDDNGDDNSDDGNNDAAEVYVLNDGETYYITVAADLEKIEDVKVANESINYIANKKAFSFVADENHNPKTIAVTLIEAQGYDVTVIMDNEDVNYVATIKADAYQNDAEGNKADADETARDITGNITYDGVWEGTDFSFELAAKDADNFKVTKVQYSTDDEKWTELTAENGKYTLEAVKAATTIKVTTDFDAEKAYSIQFVDADGNIDSVAVDYTGGESPAEKVVLGKVNYLKNAADAEVSFTVAPMTGYSVAKVSYGTDDEEVLTANDDGVYTYDKFGADAKAAVITISTKADALDADKYVKFNLGENVELDVTSPANIKPDESGVYKLTKEVKEDDEVTTAEISELAFNLTVPYGYTLEQTFVGDTTVRKTSEKRVQSEDGKSWTYSYKIVANQLSGTEDTPDEFYIDAAAEQVTLALAKNSESVGYKDLSAYNSDFQTLVGQSTATVTPGSTIILQVGQGQTLKVDGVDVTEELDALNKYSFVAKLDDTKDGDSTTVIDVQDEASYKIYYDIDPEDEAANYKSVAGEDAVEVKIGSKVFVKVTDKNGTEQAISNYELSEGAKSTVKVADQEDETGKAVITVADADVSVSLYTVVSRPNNKFYVETEVPAGTITLAAKNAAGKTLTAKGIKNNATLKLDATTETSYALTLKDGKTTLDAGAYAEALLVSSSDETVATAGIGSDGILYVNTLKGDKATADITISAKGAEDAALLTFKVEGQTPKLKVKSITSTNQGMNDILVDVAADGSVKPVNDYFDLYYEVTVAQKEGSTSTTKKDGVYYLSAEKYDAKGKYAPVSQMYKVNADTPANAVENTYTFTVRLVAVEAGTIVTEGTPEEGVAGAAIAEANVKFASDNVVKEFNTRPAYYEDKLSVTKKTTKFYSGQQDVVVAVPKFSKNAGYINDIQAVVYNKDGSLASNYYSDYSVTAGKVDLKTMEVTVSAGAYTAGSYDVVIYATAQQDEDGYSMYRASAKVPITVQKGINEISVDYPSQIAQVPDSKGVKKDVSVTLKTTGYYDWDYDKDAGIKAQTQKFTYELVSAGNQKNLDKVVVKNNKITIKKDFIIGSDPDDNRFTVLVTAADYSGNKTSEPVEITVNSEALEIASVKLVDCISGKALPQTVTTEELYGAYVQMTDKNGQEIDSSLVTLTPNKGKIYVKGYEVIIAGYQKTFTVKAVTKDGGKKSASSVKYTINYPTGVTYSIADLNLSYDESAFHQTGDLSYTYMGKGNDSINFSVKATVGDTTDDAMTALYNYSVKVVGGKVTSSKTDIAYGDYSITPNKDTVTVTITDKTKKGDKGVTYTFKDNNWQTATAPKASTKDKLYTARNAVNGSVIAQNMTYTVAKNNGYDAVKLTWVSGVSITNASGIKDIENNSFKLSGLRPNYTGTAKYSVVYGNIIEGTFYPKTKAATLSIKVNKTSTVKAVAKYTINPNVAMGVKLEAKPVPVEGMVQFNNVVSANVSGKANQFYGFFEVADGMLQIKAEKRTEDGLAALAALGKNDLTGYLEYQYSNESGSIITKQDKITVTISEKTLPKYTAAPINIVATDKASATTVIKLGNDPVNIAKVAAGAGASAGWTASAEGADAANGIVTLTATGTPTAGNVDLYVIPVGSKNASVSNTEDVRALGVKVTVKVTIKAVDDTKSKLSFAKGSVTPVASINGSKVDLTVTLTEGTDFTYNLSNEAVTTAAKTDAESITNASDKQAAEAVTSVTFKKGADDAKDTITFVLDRDKLDGNKVYNVPADLTFTSTTKATVSFSVKTEKIPTMAEVATLVDNELKDFAVTKANYNDAAKAAAEVKTAAEKIKIPAVSGIQVSAVAAVDADKFADSGSGNDVVEGDHEIKVTLTDVTKAADDEGKTADVVIVVTEKAAEKTLASALRAVITSYAVPNESGEVPEGKVAVPTTKYALQAALQAAVDSVEANTYVVEVTEFNITRASAEESGAGSGTASVLANEEGAITEISYKYEVRNAMTGRVVTDDVGSNSTVTTTGAETDIPKDSEEEEKPEETTPPTEEVTVKSVTVTAENDATTVEIDGTLTFTASVKDENDSDVSDVTVTWTVKGASDDGTKIEPVDNNTKSATLTVGSGEAKDTKLTITATVDNVTSEGVEVTVTEKTST